MTELNLGLSLGLSRRRAGRAAKALSNAFAFRSSPRVQSAAAPAIRRAGELQSVPFAGSAGRSLLARSVSLRSGPDTAASGRPSASPTVDLAPAPVALAEGRPATGRTIELRLVPALPDWTTPGSLTFNMRTSPRIVAAVTPSIGRDVSLGASRALTLDGHPGGAATIDLGLAPKVEAEGRGITPATFSDGTIWSDGTFWSDG